MLGLMNIVPAFPWYGIFTCAVVFLSFGAFIFLLLEKFSLKSALFPVSVLILSFGYPLFGRPQFTQTAGVACVAGFLILFYATTHKRRWAYIVIALAEFMILMLYSYNGTSRASQNTVRVFAIAFLCLICIQRLPGFSQTIRDNLNARNSNKSVAEQNEKLASLLRSDQQHLYFMEVWQGIGSVYCVFICRKKDFIRTWYRLEDGEQ